MTLIQRNSTLQIQGNTPKPYADTPPGGRQTTYIGTEHRDCSFNHLITQISTCFCKCVDIIQSHTKINLFRTASVLTHCDPKLPITMAADILAYGIGAVTVTHIPWWQRETYLFCISHANCQWTEIPSAGKRSMVWCTLFKSFTLVRSTIYPLLPTTSPWRQFSARRKESPHWLLHACNAGHCYCLHTPTKSNLNPVKTMVTQMGCPDYLWPFKQSILILIQQVSLMLLTSLIVTSWLPVNPSQNVA